VIVVIALAWRSSRAVPRAIVPRPGSERVIDTYQPGPATTRATLDLVQSVPALRPILARCEAPTGRPGLRTARRRVLPPALVVSAA
jgi:hypothetical protein